MTWRRSCAVEMNEAHGKIEGTLLSGLRQGHRGITEVPRGRGRSGAGGDLVSLQSWPGNGAAVLRDGKSPHLAGTKVACKEGAGSQ